MPIKRGEKGGPAEAAFGRLIQRLRKERGFSQERLAEVSGCDRSYLSFLERGINSPSLSMFMRIATALSLKPSELLAQVEAELEAEASGEIPPPTTNSP